MPVTGVFHLSHMVDDLPKAMAFYEAVFAPHVFYRGYEGGYHRDGALFAVSEFVIEALQPLGPTAEKPETSLYRYVQRFGSRVHSMAWYADGLPPLTAAFEQLGARVIDEGATVFSHPKDFPGMVELFDPGSQRSLPDPRRVEGWSARYWRSHPLGIEYASHVTAVVRDHQQAAKLYASAMGSEILPEQPASTPGGAATFVTVGSETVVELAQPDGGGTAAAGTLEAVGETYTGATFKVGDLAAVEDHLARLGVPAARLASDLVVIDPVASMGAVYGFTDRVLTGDHRAAR